MFLGADVTLWGAFIAGVLSFLSPCVLPLVPGYLSFISGASVADVRSSADRVNLLLRAGLFVLGFSLVFVMLGASATSLGLLLARYQDVLARIAGALILLFGIHYLGLYRLRFLDYEKRYHIQRKSVGLLGSFVVGLAFAFGWTPCIGPILGSILAIASAEATVQRGIVLLGVYSAGLGIPFLLSALLVDQFMRSMRRMRSVMGVVEKASGVLLIALGLFMLSGKMSIVGEYLNQWLL